MMKLIKDIPIEYMNITDQIIQIAKQELKMNLDDTLYINITDHIYTSIERYKENLPLKNHLLMDIKHFYKKEFELGMYTLELIEQNYGIRMYEDEAAFLAMHIVCSEIGRNIDDVYEITSFIQEILELVRKYFRLEYKEDSLSYYRFVTHLKFFGKRIFSKVLMVHDDVINNDLLELMKSKYVQPYLRTLEIKTFIEKKYKYHLGDDEILFLTIHVAKIISNK